MLTVCFYVQFSEKFDNAVELGSRSALLVIYNNVIIKNDETHEDLESHKKFIEKIQVF